MADQSLDNSGDQESEGSRLRKQNDDLRAKLAKLEQENAIRDSGLELNDRQRRVVLRELTDDKLELTADNIKAVAKELGYSKPESTSTSTESQSSNSDSPTPTKLEDIVNEEGLLKAGFDADTYKRIAMQAQFAAAGGMQTQDSDGNDVTFERFDAMLKEAQADPDLKSGQAKQMKLIQQYGHMFGMADAELFD